MTDDEAEKMQPIVSIDMDGDTYYVGMWFLASKLGRDFMCVVSKPAGADRFHLSFRFRYYDDPDELKGFNPFDANDRKHSYQCDAPADQTEAQVIKTVDEMVDELVRTGWVGTKLPWKVREYRHKDLCRGDGEAFKRMLVGLPYTHITTDPGAYK